MFSQLTALEGSYQMGYCYIRDTALFEFIHSVITQWMLTGCPGVLQNAETTVTNYTDVILALTELIIYWGRQNLVKTKTKITYCEMRKEGR